MFEQLENNPKSEPKWYGARILAASVAGLLLSFGLCGLGNTFRRGTGLSILDMMGLYLFFLSIIGIFTGVVVLIVEAIIAALNK